MFWHVTSLYNDINVLFITVEMAVKYLFKKNDPSPFELHFKQSTLL